MTITQEVAKSLDWETVRKQHGEPRTKYDTVLKPSNLVKMASAWKKYIHNSDIDLLCPAALAHAVAANVRTTTSFKSRCENYKRVRGLIRHYICGDESATFVNDTNNGYHCLGGEGCPVSPVDGSELDANAPPPPILPHCVECQGEVSDDLCDLERRRRERNLAFVLYTADMKWVYQYADGEDTFQCTSPLPQRSKELVLGLGAGSGFANYLDTSGNEWTMVARDFKTNKNGDAVMDDFITAKSNKLRYVQHYVITPEVKAYIVEYLKSVPSDSKALFPLATGKVPATEYRAQAAAEREVEKYIHDITKKAGENKPRQWCYGVSALRASFIKYAVDKPDYHFSPTAERPVFSICLAAAMRHSPEQQVMRYYLKKQNVPGVGKLLPIPWEWCQAHCAALMNYTTD